MDELTPADPEDYKFLYILYRREFERDFTPMSGVVDDSRAVEGLVGVVERARNCLGERTDAQVAFIAEFSDWIASAAVRAGRVVGVFPDGSEAKVTADLADRLDPRPVLRIACDSVRAAIKDASDGEFSITLQDEVGNTVCEVDGLTPRDILAAHALVQFVRATEYQSADWFCFVGVTHAMIASECVALAEAESDFKAKLSDMTSRASKVRWSKQEPLRELANKIYGGRKWQSRAEAVRSITPTILNEAKTRSIRLSPLNAPKTIDGWLKGLKKD